MTEADILREKYWPRKTGMSREQLRAFQQSQVLRRGKQILHLLAGGLSARDVQRELGLSERQVYYALRRARSER